MTCLIHKIKAIYTELLIIRTNKYLHFLGLKIKYIRTIYGEFIYDYNKKQSKQLQSSVSVSSLKHLYHEDPHFGL